MTHTIKDLRVRRTHKLLREALINLIENEGRNFNDITVGEIAKHAMVSRAAFYRYYQDKYDLVEQIFEETMSIVIKELDELKQTLSGNIPYTSSQMTRLNEQKYLIDEVFPPAPWVSIFEHFATYEHLYRALLGENGSPWFGKKLHTYLAALMVERTKNLSFYPEVTMLADQRTFQEGFMPMVLAGLILDTIRWWLEHNLPYPPGQIAAYCYRLLIVNLREVNTWG